VIRLLFLTILIGDYIVETCFQNSSIKSPKMDYPNFVLDFPASECFDHTSFV
jgi:hypothetical protein